MSAPCPLSPRLSRSWLALAGALALLTPFATAEDETLLLQEPTVSEDHVVFVYASDLWVVGREGGDARRLTSNPGVESSPKLSPNGRWVAFTGQYEGNPDVYVISIDSGMPKRLTWHPGGDQVVDWHPDGEQVLFRSARSSDAPVRKLFLVSVEGGIPRELAIPKANHASYNGDATRIAYTPFRDAFRSWKRYRGGTTPPIWIFDPETRKVEVVPHENASDTFPGWLDGNVYFASDRNETMNLFRYQPGSNRVERLTSFIEFDVRNMDCGGGVVVFEQAGAIHLFDPKDDSSRRLSIRVLSDGLAAIPRWQEVKGHVRSASIAPNGKRAVFEARGEIITIPREHGDARNLTQSPGMHDRSPSWSNDGERIAWFNDESGEYKLVIRDRRGFGEMTSFELGGGGFYHDPIWSPDDEHILFHDKTNRIAYLTLETGQITDVSRIEGSLGEVRPGAVWSPDSKWIAFENRNPRTMYDHIALYELESGKITPLTDGFGFASSPAFSPDNKHLFFQASVELGPKLFGLDMSSSASRSPEGSLYVAVLQKDAENPLAPKSDEAVEEEEEEDEKDADEDADPEKKEDESVEAEETAVAEADEDEKEDEQAGDKKKKEKELPAIDLEDLDQRILALPTGKGNYSNLDCTKKKLLFVERPQGGEPTLKSFDFDSREKEDVKKGVSGFEVSSDGKWILTASREGKFEIAKADGKDAKPLQIASVKVRVEPEEEWPQILREVWRIQRDYFYDENMHGVDWPQMWDRWEDFLPHVRHRNDLTVVIRELIGELACGHQYTRGGETPEAPTGVSVGLLGADFDVADNRYQIRKIYRGQNWNPGMRAPLTAPGVDADEGDYLIEVNGRPIEAQDNLYRLFENTADKQVRLTVSANADGSESRTMTVVPIGNESRLRRQSWIEDNRRRVDELSGGRLAYIYMPNTGNAGRASFDRDFYSQLDKQGVVLDERYNGGGQAANYIIATLSRKVMSYWMNREKWLAQSPFGVMEGPKVMIINESAGSGGDWMPWIFQNTGLGPLVGTRTWGGLVGISGYPPLMDGGSVTAASFGVMDTEGYWAVENVGVYPDHEVIEWPEEILAGRDPQLEKAVQVALERLNSQSLIKTRPASFSPPKAR